MSEKVIIRSSVVDAHGDLTPGKLLADDVETLNGPSKMRHLVNHRRDIPPLGYFDNAEVIVEKGVVHLLAEPILFSKKEDILWAPNLLLERGKQDVTLMSRNRQVDNVTLTLDRNNFRNIESLKNTVDIIKRCVSSPIAFEMDMRKSWYLDPRILITLGSGFLIKPLISPILKKLGERIADDVAESVYEQAKARVKVWQNDVRDIIRNVAPRIANAKRPLLVILEISGDPYIEISVRSNDPNAVANAMGPKSLAKVFEFIKSTPIESLIAEVYFTYKDNAPVLSYFLLKDGSIIGTKKSFKLRDNLMKRIQLKPSNGYSIGGNIAYKGVNLNDSEERVE